MLRIKLVKSPIGHNTRNRRTIAALGLRKVHQVVELPDNPSVRGMIFHVKEMLSVEEVANTEATPKAAPKAKAVKETPVETVAATEEAPAKPARKPRAKKEGDEK